MRSIYIFIILIYSSIVISQESSLKADIEAVNGKIRSLKLEREEVASRQLAVLRELNVVAKKENTDEKIARKLTKEAKNIGIKDQNILDEMHLLYVKRLTLYSFLSNGCGEKKAKQAFKNKALSLPETESVSPKKMYKEYYREFKKTYDRKSIKQACSFVRGNTKK